jgi:ABC-2 type transport system ATP-binding protein
MIEVEKLSKVFVDTPVVDDVTFFVPEGQVLGFLGPNGAGKTTAMRMITTYLRPTQGRVLISGIDVDSDPIAVRRNIGYLPENVPLYPEMRVDEYLRFRADVEGIPHREQTARLEDVLDRCFLADVRRQVIGTLSKGYRQRVGLAGALIHAPDVLILDEPTVGLDPNQIIKIRELITELGKDHTVLLSTHILPEVEQICERVLIIDQGRIVADGTPHGLQSRTPQLQTLTLELKDVVDVEAEEVFSAIDDVEEVVSQGGGRFGIVHGPKADPREAVFRAVVEKGWIVLEMTPGKASLEDVFVRLTTREEVVEENAEV